MGMYDTFLFAEGILPENKMPPEHEFQTKDMDCQLHKFIVDKYGLVKTIPEGIEIEAATVYVYSYDFNQDPIYEQHYKLIIVDNKLKRAVLIFQGIA